MMRLLRRRGLNNHIIVKKKKRPTDTESRISRCCIGGTTNPCKRFAPEGSIEMDRVSTKVLKRYQTCVGGVDVHDQFRFERYSLQLAVMYENITRISSLVLWISQ
ncbi:Hypothetical protein PHPALM_6169 [Phytophthora palmivora]|uniref:Uncharacterized protein n=1 Tax=Phytophthora palmivora TaxID=4796 RepID=A0A2P4YFV0_9STRA|nr:Hypothetical protein PHPALM_6169 [Phytophthora palmivora]